MAAKRKIEIFNAGCAVCESAISRIRDLACPSCEIEVLDMTRPYVADRTRSLGIQSVPAIVIDDQLADCCAGRGPNEAVLKAAALGTPLP